ncbi:MAG: molybdopterin molybdotransferase MoeA [Hyphomicrobiaceae bacterium]
MTRKLVDDCFYHDPRDEHRLSHDEAIAHLKAQVSPVVGTVELTGIEAVGRISAEPVKALRPVPGHTNAAVDGYAFSHRDLERDGDTLLEVVGRAAAGSPYVGPQLPKQAVRIFTGAVVPDGCDTVAMQEDCGVGFEGANTVSIPPGLKAGANVRGAGEDVQTGQTLMSCGDPIRPQDVAAIASVGLDKIKCFDRLRVAVVSTGDEVLRAGAGEPKLGQVFDTNAPLLLALCGLAGCTVSDLGVWPDDRQAVDMRLAAAARDYDVVLTSGGASLGEEDYMAQAITDLGQRHFWQIAVKPGRPLMFGQIGDTVIVGLPGNPVAVFVCFLMYVYPVLRRLGGATWPEPRRFALPAAFAVENRKIGRREFWRGTTVQAVDGLQVEKYPRDGSGLISGLRAADGLIDISEVRPSVERGDFVDFIPFSEYGIT